LVFYSDFKRIAVILVASCNQKTVVKRKARIGRNPQSMEAIKIPAKTIVRMRVAKVA